MYRIPGLLHVCVYCSMVLYPCPTAACYPFSPKRCLFGIQASRPDQYFLPAYTTVLLFTRIPTSTINTPEFFSPLSVSVYVGPKLEKSKTGAPPLLDPPPPGYPPSPGYPKDELLPPTDVGLPDMTCDQPGTIASFVVNNNCGFFNNSSSARRLELAHTTESLACGYSTSIDKGCWRFWL